jgi:hypothetical protein
MAGRWTGLELGRPCRPRRLVRCESSDRTRQPAARIAAVAAAVERLVDINMDGFNRPLPLALLCVVG